MIIADLIAITGVRSAPEVLWKRRHQECRLWPTRWCKKKISNNLPAYSNRNQHNHAAGCCRKIPGLSRGCFRNEGRRVLRRSWNDWIALPSSWTYLLASKTPSTVPQIVRHWINNFSHVPNNETYRCKKCIYFYFVKLLPVRNILVQSLGVLEHGPDFISKV